MKKLLTFGAGALLVSALVMPALAEQEAGQPPALSRTVRMAKTDKPVMFPHAPHTAQSCTPCHESTPWHFPPLSMNAKEDCDRCHHTGEYTKCSDSGCHDNMDIKDKSESSYFRIFHDRKVENSCLNCHFKVAQTRPEKKQALTACADSSCHPKP